jgi:uncharacterized protein YfeS
VYWKQAAQEIDQNKAEKLLTPGAYQPRTSNKIKLAAAMQTIQIMYNMQEAITKT